MANWPSGLGVIRETAIECDTEGAIDTSELPVETVMLEYGIVAKDLMDHGAVRSCNLLLQLTSMYGERVYFKHSVLHLHINSTLWIA